MTASAFTTTTPTGLLTVNALKIKLTSPQYSDEVKLAALDHAYAAASSDRDHAQAHAISELWRAFWPTTEFYNS